MYIRFIISIALVLLTSLSFAQSLKEAADLFGAGKYGEAEKILNNINPQTAKVKGFLCQLYAEEKISPDVTKSKELCEDAVASKDPMAVYIYAISHIYGSSALQIKQNEKRGLGFMSVSAIDMDFAPAFDFFCEKFFLEKKYDDAVNFCKVAASTGLRKSLYRMGIFYSEGIGVIQDFDKSKSLIIASAALNYPLAYDFLGDASRDGKNGFAIDTRHAYAWYSLSIAAKSSQEIQDRRKALKLSQEDVIASQKMATAWKFKTPRLIDFNSID